MNSVNVRHPDRLIVAHVVFRFDYGGLENGVVNIVNRLPVDSIKSVIIALTESTQFKNRLRDEVEVYSIGKRAGKDLLAYWRLYKVLKRIRPDILHTRNAGTLECAVVGFLAGIPVRIHGEHGWDIFDPDGTNRKFRMLRQVCFRFVNRITTVSEELRRWTVDVVGMSDDKVQRIYNGVDTERFRPPRVRAARGEVVVVSVTRFAEIKDPICLLIAFAKVCKAREDVRLVMIGDGPLRSEVIDLVESEGIAHRVTLPGFHDDIPEILREADVFALSSLREGISNTILEAMASGLPVVATNTGGTSEIVENGVNGVLVAPGNPEKLARAIEVYANDQVLRVRHGKASRSRAVTKFSLAAMTSEYQNLYENNRRT